MKEVGPELKNERKCSGIKKMRAYVAKISIVGGVLHHAEGPRWREDSGQGLTLPNHAPTPDGTAHFLIPCIFREHGW